MRLPASRFFAALAVASIAASSSACVTAEEAAGGGGGGGGGSSGGLDTGSAYDTLYATEGPGGTPTTVFGTWKLEQDNGGYRVEVRLRLTETAVQLASRCFVDGAAVTPGVTLRATVTEQLLVVQESGQASDTVGSQVCQVQLTAGQAQLILADGKLSLGAAYTFPTKISD